MSRGSQTIRMLSRTRRSTAGFRSSGLRRFGNERPRVTVEWATLIGRVAEGDREAFRRLFEHFAPRVKGLMLKAGASSDDAEEIAQETLLAVWRKAAQFDPVSAGASAWIYTIARNLRIDSVRRAARTGAVDHEAELDYLVDPAEPADDAMARNDEAEPHRQRPCRASPRSNPWRSGCRSSRNVRIPKSRTSSGYRWGQ